MDSGEVIDRGQLSRSRGISNLVMDLDDTFEDQQTQDHKIHAGRKTQTMDQTKKPQFKTFNGTSLISQVLNKSHRNIYKNAYREGSLEVKMKSPCGILTAKTPTGHLLTQKSARTDLFPIMRCLAGNLIQF